MTASPTKRKRPLGEAAIDLSTAPLRWAAATVGTTHPVRFGLVLMGAVAIQGTASIVFAISPQAWLNAVATLPVYQMTCITFTVLFTPLIFARHRISEEALTELALIDKYVKRAGFSSQQRQEYYADILRNKKDNKESKKIGETELLAIIENVKKRTVP